MSAAALRRQVAGMMRALAERVAPPTPLMDQLRADPARIMAAAGMTPDPWQAKLLRGSAERMLLLCSRQSGKSQTAAALALKAALLEPRSLVLLLSPTMRQSGELFRDKVLKLYDALGWPVPPVRKPTQLSLELTNGSRVVSLPENEGGIRGFSGVRLLIIDEASRVSESLYRAVRPMLAVSRGRLAVLSTPFGKQGWFYDEFIGKNAWERVRITADQCPRITPEFLAEERDALGDRWYRQEYFCSFEEVIDAVFSQEDVEAACRDGARPLFTGTP